MKNQRKLVILTVAILALSMIGNTLFKPIDTSLSNHNFSEALKQLIATQSAKKPLYDAKNAISLYLDKGMLEHYAGDYKSSSESLQNAERLIEEAFTKSVSENVASYVLNDNTKEYPGEDFENIYLNVFNALNYIKQDDIESALVEIRKLTMTGGKLDLLESKYEEGNKKTEAPSRDDASKVNFSNSALARYLSVLLFLEDNDEDAVRIELEQLNSAFSNQPGIYGYAIPKAVENLTSFPADQARLDILSFAGLGPIKEERVFKQRFSPQNPKPLQEGNFKLPVLIARANRIDRMEVKINDEVHEMGLLEDMSAVIIDTFIARFNNIFNKTYNRTMVKYIALALTYNQAVQSAKNPIAKKGAELALEAGKKTFDATEGADVRMSRYLPNKAFIGSVNLDPGTYKVTVNYFSGNSLVYSETRDNVEVKMNTLNLLQTVNLDLQM